MRKYLYYIILFIGGACISSEFVNDFTEMKLLKATFYPNKYFEADELRDTLSLSYGGTNPAANLNIYYGKLVKNKIEGKVKAYENFIVKISQKTGNIPVWFCNIKGVNKLKFRTTDVPPNTPFKNAYLYIFFG